MSSDTEFSRLRAGALLLGALVFVASAVAQDLNLYSAQDKVVAKSAIIFGYSQPVQIRIANGFGSVEDTRQPFSPALICDDDIPKQFTLDCYEARTAKDVYFDDPHVKFVDITDSHQAVLFSANVNYSGSGWTWLWSLLILNHDGLWQNLFPEVTSSNQSEQIFWSSPAVSSYKIFSVADFIWTRAETHFAAHRYQIKSYRYCPSTSKYTLADELTTTRKFPGLDGVENLEVIRPEMPEIERRLKQKATTACSQTPVRRN